MKKSWIITHLILLFICFVGTIFATIGIFNMSGMVYDHMDEHWEEISNLLNKEGYQVRKSYMVNQLIMQLKLTGFYLIAFIVFNGISFCTSFYIFYNFSDFLASAYNQKSNYFSNDLSRNPSHFQSEVFNYNKEIKES